MARQTQRASMMDFYAVLDQVLALLRQRGRVSYRALKRQFDLDDAYLERIRISFLSISPSARPYRGRGCGERV